ncbi:MAG: HlyC/CorC family transporter [Acidobacteria bacterium]|nr:HlyC/CorC family transporter [Acidobacteriota bacterium]
MVEWALFRILTVAIFILATAFFVAAEFALVSIRETRFEQLVAAGRPGAATALRLKRNMDEFLPANQLGVTLASLALGYLGEASLAEIVLQIIHHTGFLQTNPFIQHHLLVYTHGFSIAVSFFLITYFEVLLGEQVPKALALQRGERIAIAIAGPMDVFIRITRPAVKLMRGSAAIVLRAFRVHQTSEEGDTHSPEEIKLVATASRRGGLLPPFQEQIIHRAIELNHVTVREVMTPRSRIFSLPADMPIERASARIVDEQHSRIPVFDPQQGAEHIVGIVYSKDISRLMHFHAASHRAGDTGLTLRTVMRDILLVPETKLVAELLQEFRERRRQIAIVVDEFGSTVGLVTAEDLLEQVVGELEDEFDIATRSFNPVAPGTYEVEGTASLRDLTTHLGWNFPRDAGVETLAGFLLAQFGHIPQTGESVEYEDRRYTVLQTAGRRVSRIRIEDLKPERETTLEKIAG